MATYKDNKWLIVNPGVKMTPAIEPGVIRLDKFFEEAQLRAHITSGLRDSVDQLNTILKYCKRYKIDTEFPEILTCKFNDKLLKEPSLFAWQRPWSKLLNIGVIINPPLPAACLYDYINADGVNKKGRIIGHSPHYWGKAADCGGGVDHDITNELVVIEKALASKKIPGMKGIVKERKNNCVHIDFV
jgi:hypothetical protein